VCVIVVCLFIVFYVSSALKILLENGVDVNIQDEFSNVYRVARQKKYDRHAGVHPLIGGSDDLI